MAGIDIINQEAARLGVTPQQLAQQIAQQRGLTQAAPREIPEITGERFSEITPFVEGLKAKVGVFAASTPEQEIDILSKVEGFEGVRQDPELGDVVKFKGEEFAVNKPGFSAADVLKFATQAVPFIAGGRLGARGKGLKRLAGGGAGGAAGSITLDLVAGAAGSEQGVSAPRAVFFGGAGVLGEVLAPMIGSGFQFLKQKFGRTPKAAEVREMLESIGVAPESLTDDALEALTRELDTAADPAAAVRLAEAETLPVRVPQTRGTLTQIPEEQLLEESARKGAFGAPSREVVETVQREGQEALRANVPAIQARLSGGTQQVTQRGQGGAIAQEALSEQEQALGREVTAGFQAARGAQGGPLVQELRGTINDITSAAADRIPFAPNAKVLADDLKALLKTEKTSAVVPSAREARVAAGVPTVTSANRSDDIIFMSVDSKGKVPSSGELKEILKSSGASVGDLTVTKFATDIISGTQGITKYRIDLRGEKNAKKLFKDAFGQDAPIFGSSELERAVPLDERFNKVLGAISGKPPKSSTGPLPEDVAAVFSGGVSEASIPIRELFNWRRRASTLRNDIADRTEKGAIGQMIKRFDERVSNNLDTALLQGDEDAAKLWAKANQARAKQGKIFQSGDILETLTERQGKTLLVDPSEASNKIFGTSNLNLITKSGLRRDLVKLKGQLNPDEWNAVREEAFLRFTEQAEGALQGDVRQFSGAKFKNAWDQAKRRNPEVIRTLFGANEIKLIDQFGNVAARTTNPVFGGSNPSGTAAALTRIVQTVFKGPTRRLQEILTAGSDVAAGLKGAGVRGAVRGGIERRPPIPAGLGAGITAAALGASGEAGEFEQRR